MRMSIPISTVFTGTLYSFSRCNETPTYLIQNLKKEKDNNENVFYNNKLDKDKRRFSPFPKTFSTICINHNFFENLMKNFFSSFSIEFSNDDCEIFDF